MESLISIVLVEPLLLQKLLDHPLHGLKETVDVNQGLLNALVLLPRPSAFEKADVVFDAFIIKV